MARVRGRDVMLELMDTVAKLEAGQARHAEQLETLAAVAAGSEARMTGMEQRLGHMGQRLLVVERGLAEVQENLREVQENLHEVQEHLHEVQGAVTELRGDMEYLRARVGELEHDTHLLSEGFKASAEVSREQGTHLKRLGQLLGQLADGSSSRFDALEERIAKLERKAG